jgi:alpha-aminoadipate carrier protein LysW
MKKVTCPSCGENVNVSDKPKMGQRVVCKECDTELEVVWLDPLELDWPMDEYERDDDDDSFEDMDDYDEEEFEEDEEPLDEEEY